MGSVVQCLLDSPQELCNLLAGAHQKSASDNYGKVIYVTFKPASHVFAVRVINSDSR